MNRIETLEQLELLVKEQKTPKMAVAFAQDEDTLLAVKRAVE